MVAVVIVMIGCRRMDNAQAMAHDSFFADIHYRFRQSLMEVQHHRWIKWCRVLKVCQADEQLEIWILFDLLKEFFIREPHAYQSAWCMGLPLSGRIRSWGVTARGEHRPC
jgi:hypothetical protein